MSTMDGNSMSNNDSEQQVEYEVPHDLKRLIRIIMKAFYNFELYLCMEMLMIYPCVKEEDLAELLRMDVKTVHQLLLNLKKDKFVNEKSMMETSQDGSKHTKHSYFYINYRMLVCVVRYKLDRIRMLIEIDDNQSNTRALYKCTVCSKTYSDEDTKDIFYTMRCIHCGGDIDEDTSSLPKQSTRNLMNKFNNQTLLISELLSRVEHVRLADKILRPEPIDISYVLRRLNPVAFNVTPSSATLSGAGMTSASSSLNLMGGGGKAAMIKYDKATSERLRTQTTVSINRDSTDSGGQAKRPIKELPSIILANRTNEEEFNRDSFLLNSVRQAADETINSTNAITNKSTLSDSTNFTQSSSAGAKGAQSNASNGAACVASPSAGGSSNGAANSSTTFNSAVNSTNLEQIILQKLLKHEKKAMSMSESSSSSSSSKANADASSTNSNKNSNYPLANGSLSSITVTKKRPIDALLSGPGANHDSHSKNAYLANHPLNKKRKLMEDMMMNGGSGDDRSCYVHKSNGYHSSSLLRRNHSDGNGSENSSENSDDYDDDYYGAQYDSQYRSDFDDSSPIDLHNGNMRNRYLGENDDADFDDSLIPRVSVQNRLYRFDLITPKLINLMNQNEKDDYINICKQLYTEIYEV